MVIYDSYLTVIPHSDYFHSIARKETWTSAFPVYLLLKSESNKLYTVCPETFFEMHDKIGWGKTPSSVLCEDDKAQC
jgi:hypothetical protein